MKIRKRSILPLKVVLLILMLLGSNSSSLFLANPEFAKRKIAEDHQDFISISNIGGPVGNLFDSILPAQRNSFFRVGSFATVGDLKNNILCYNSTSQFYIKRSRFIIPALGVKKVIFPFHVFL